MMDSYTSEWNKETVMAHATRLLHITQELAVAAVPKYTKKQYARLGFGSSSLMNMNEEDELALVQEAYTIAWKYWNLTLEYTPIARTTLKLHTHHGALGNFIGTLGQDNRVLIGDNQGIYVCSSSGDRLARWYKPRTERASTHPDYTTAYTGRVLTGTRTSTIQTGRPTDLNAITDVEPMSSEEPTSFLLRSDYWWLTWYPKQQYMMIHKSESTTSCEHPSEVTWSYRLAPSSYKQFMRHKDSSGIPSEIDFRTQYPIERNQTDYSYEVHNERGGFDWVEVKGNVPVYKCPPTLVGYFNSSFGGKYFEGDVALEQFWTNSGHAFRSGVYKEMLSSVSNPLDVSGYVIWETVVKLNKVHYLQAEFFSVPLDEVFPIRQGMLFSRGHKAPEPRQHSSGKHLPSASNEPIWVYYPEQGADIQIKASRPEPKLYNAGNLYRLKWNVEIARNASGLAMYPNIKFFMSPNEGYFDDSVGFTFKAIVMLGVRYTPDGVAYAVCIQESFCVREWTEWDNVDVPQSSQIPYPPKTVLLKEQVDGIDWQPLQKLIMYDEVKPIPESNAPSLDLANYEFGVQLARWPNSSIPTGQVRFRLEFIRPGRDATATAQLRFWVYSHESEQYQYMLNTPTGNSGFYTPPLPEDTYTLPKASGVF